MTTENGLITDSSYHNSNEETGSELVDSETKAKRQEDHILHFLQNNPDSRITAEDINKIIPELLNAPRTSIRRALTNLNNKDLILNVGQRRSIDTNKKIGEYMYNPAPITGKLLAEKNKKKRKERRLSRKNHVDQLVQKETPAQPVQQIDVSKYTTVLKKCKTLFESALNNESCSLDFFIQGEFTDMVNEINDIDN